jgi:hypothetical protein
VSTTTPTISERGGCGPASRQTPPLEGALEHAGGDGREPDRHHSPDRHASPVDRGEERELVEGDAEPAHEEQRERRPEPSEPARGERQGEERRAADRHPCRADADRRVGAGERLGRAGRPEEDGCEENLEPGHLAQNCYTIQH